MYILGISAFFHDSAACLIKDGKIIAAAQEERFTRKKHDSDFPQQAIKFCLKFSKINAEEINNIVFYEKPFLKFERLLETYLAFAPKGFSSFKSSMPIWIKYKLFQKSLLIKKLSTTLGNNIDWKKKLLFCEHHLSHAASAFYPSPFRNAAILTIDAVGEWTTTSIAIGKGREIKILKELHFPHSLGLLYSAFTYYAGFKVNSGEYKLMGLAPYGKPRYSELIQKKLITVADDGSFQIDMSYFNYATGLSMTNKKFDNLFGGPPRIPETEITQREMDLAASIQKVTENIVLKIAKNIVKETGQKNLCLAGGVALNCVVNGALINKKIFENIWIQPAAGDAGGSLGAALSVWHLHYKKERQIQENNDQMNGSYLGPEFTDDEIESELQLCGAKFNKFSENDLINQVTDLLINQKVIGWMQGRMEFGPRALGARSIISDARSENMQKKLNIKIKYRENFRPFAPSILYEDQDQWFENNIDSPYMLLVSSVKKDKRIKNTEDENSLFGINKLSFKRSSIPAVTHIDFSSRIHSVEKKRNYLFHKLIAEFKSKTNYPLIVNTSFNIRGEPIVCSPKDAFKCFMGTGLDALVIGNYLLIKDQQDNKLKNSYLNIYGED